MLESLEQSNIKRMSVENPEEKEKPFDMENPITPEDIESIRGYVTKAFEEKHWVDALDALYYGEKLGYKKDLSVNLNIPIAKMKEGVSLHPTGVTMSELRAYSEAQHLFSVMLDLNQEVEHVNKRHELEKSAREDGRWYDLAILAEKYGSAILIADEVEKVTEQAKGFVKDYPTTAVHLAAILKEINPKFDLESFNFDMEKVKQEIVDYKSKGKWPEYLVALYYLKQLGVDLPEPLEEEKSQPMPEQKNF